MPTTSRKEVEEFDDVIDMSAEAQRRQNERPSTRRTTRFNQTEQSPTEHSQRRSLGTRRDWEAEEAPSQPRRSSRKWTYKASFDLNIFQGRWNFTYDSTSRTERTERTEPVRGFVEEVDEEEEQRGRVRQIEYRKSED